MNPILVFRHIECEGPGYLADFLGANNVPFQLVCIDSGEAVPDSLDSIGGLVFMGGPMSVNDALPWIEAELNLIRHAHQYGIPVLGHCLGGQLVAKALGGEVLKNKVQETGWFPVSSYDDCLPSHWLTGLPEKFNAFHLHGETFTIPEGATPLFRSQFCPQQAFVKGNSLALQFHVEVTKDMVKDWVSVYQKDLEQPSESIQSRNEILRDLDKRVAEVHQIAKTLYTHWLDNVYGNSD